MRDTSVQAFVEIKESGYLGDRQLEVYKAVYEHGPITAGQIAEQHKIKGAWKRLSELRDQRLIQEVGQTTCPVSNMTVILWDITGRGPVTKDEARRARLLKRKETLKSQLTRINEQLEEFGEAEYG